MNCCRDSAVVLTAQATAVLLASLAVERLVRLMGVERILQPEVHKMEDRFAESLKRAGLEPIPVAAQSLHAYLTHPIRTWIRASGNLLVFLLVAHYFSSSGSTTLTVFGVSTAHTFDTAQRALFLLWRLVSILCFAWTVITWEKEAFSRLARRDPQDAQALGAASSLVRRITFVAATLLFLDTVGVSLKALLAFGGVGGLALGLASQVVASNIVSGASLLAARIFREGDKIEIVGKNAIGYVERFGVANTQLRLEDGSPYYIPNSELSKNAIRNLSASRLSHRRIQASFRVPYDALPLVRELTRRMEAYLRSRKDVDDIPDRHPTRVVLGDVDEYSLVLSVQAFVPAPGMPLVEFDRIKSEVLLDLGDIISSMGVALEYPTRRVSPRGPPPGSRAVDYATDFAAGNVPGAFAGGLGQRQEDGAGSSSMPAALRAEGAGAAPAPPASSAAPAGVPPAAAAQSC